MPKRPEKESVFQIRVQLKHIHPPIWRQLQVPGSITLSRLHDVIQLAMGWMGTHLHSFEAGGRHFARPHSEDFIETEDSTEVTLREVAPWAKCVLAYEYDFGDGWTHEIVVEKVLPGPSHGALCIAGKRACPPEDCGGPPGYEHLLQVLSDPEDPEHLELTAWAPPKFDAEAFEVVVVNKLLTQLMAT